MKSLNTVFAKDMLISLASKLPENLLVDSINPHGIFCIEFLLRLKEEEICDLRREARKHTDDIFLFFYSIPSDKNGKEPAHEMKDFLNFDFSKIEKIIFNGSTVPLLQYNNHKAVSYVSVTFVLKS